MTGIPGEPPRQSPPVTSERPSHPQFGHVACEHEDTLKYGAGSFHARNCHYS